MDEVELIEANPQYAFIKRPDGTETTVSIKDLAPCGEVLERNEPTCEPSVTLASETGIDSDALLAEEGEDLSGNSVQVTLPETPSLSPVELPKSPILRRSDRNRFPTKRLITEV